MSLIRCRFTLHPSLSLSRVASALPFTYTGADLYALCSDAMLKAITRQATAVDEKISKLPGGPVPTARFFDHYATKEDIAVMVTEDDFLEAQRELVGSVSAKELEHYHRVQQSFESTEEESSDRVVTTARTSNSRSNSEMLTVNGKSKAKGKGVSGRFQNHHVDNSDDSLAPYEDGAVQANHLKVTGVEAKRAEKVQKSREKAASRSWKAGQFMDPSENDDEELYS